MYTYMMVLNDFGIRPSAIWKLSTIRAPLPNVTDQYNPDAENFGNTNMNGEDVAFGWDLTKHSKIDIRLFYAAHRTEEAWTSCRWDPNDEEIPKFMRYSHISDRPICYSTESLKYAQAAYLVAIVTVQASGMIACKTRNLSLYQQGMINQMGNFGLFSEFALVAILLYVPPLNIALGTRMIPLPHFAVPSMSFYIAIFFYDEIRKLFLRRGMVHEEGRLRLKGWIVQNTYY
jgi:hypothetical protein